MFQGLDEGSLWPIVHRLDRKTEAGRRACADHPVTRAFIAAGLRLTERQFALPVSADEAAKRRRADERMGCWLSRTAVLGEASKADPNRICTEGKFRTRWATQADYIADLVSYVLSRRHWALQSLARRDLIESLKSAPDFARSVNELAAATTDLALSSPICRVQLVAAAYAERDPVVCDALAQTYELIDGGWAAVYHDVMAARGLRLRPGVPLSTVTHALTALDEGVAMRMLAEIHTQPSDSPPPNTMLGQMVLLLLIGCVDPGDGKTAYDAVNEIVARATPPHREG
jgi:hypothetical protein